MSPRLIELGDLKVVSARCYFGVDFDSRLSGKMWHPWHHVQEFLDSNLYHRNEDLIAHESCKTKFAEVLQLESKAQIEAGTISYYFVSFGALLQ